MHWLCVHLHVSVVDAAFVVDKASREKLYLFY